MRCEVRDMIEVLFTESAAGSMQYAKSMKHTIGEAHNVIFFTDDGCKLPPEQIAQVEEEWRKRREKDVPMEGNAEDVAYFPLGLSMGDILEPFSDERAGFLQRMVLISGEKYSDVGETLVRTARKSLEKVLNAAQNGEPIRIWYSHNPDELCGFCHLVSILPETADIRAVKLPEYEETDGAVVTYTGWGEVEPGQLAAFLSLERKLTRLERLYFSGLWRQLRRNNGPLRAIVNGKLCTVDADFYDPFILKELSACGEEFQEARFIGSVLGKYQLGIGDWLVAMRMEEFIARGMLIPVTEPEKDCPIYHRYLRKI